MATNIPKPVNQQILDGMASAFFAIAWAELNDNAPHPVNVSGLDIMDLMPDTVDPAAVMAALSLAKTLTDTNQYTGTTAPVLAARIDLFYQHVVRLQPIDDQGDRELTPELFGHYCAMQAMGTGVGLESFGHAVRDAIKVPYLEFGSDHLELAYLFPNVGSAPL